MKTPFTISVKNCNETVTIEKDNSDVTVEESRDMLYRLTTAIYSEDAAKDIFDGD